jgi:hypothetical protein
VLDQLEVIPLQLLILPLGILDLLIRPFYLDVEVLSVAARVSTLPHFEKFEPVLFNPLGHCVYLLV